MLICAFTGKAAANVNGLTLHSAFGLKFGHENQSLSDKSLAEFRQNFADLKLIIIDEMSLLNSDMLYRIHLRLMEIFQTKELFGGLSVILVGDLLQLPPVGTNEYIFEEPYNSHFKPYHKVMPLWESFEPFILRHNHRTGEGNTWTETLNRIRVGEVTEEDMEVLKSRQTGADFLYEDCLHLFYTNEEVDDHNEKMLNKLDGELYTISAIKLRPKGYVEKKTKKGKKPKKTVDGTQFFDKLEVKVGARCMLIFNVDIVDDLVNGGTGNIIGIETNSKGQVDCIVVQFDDEKCGSGHRQKYSRISEKYKENNGTPIFRHELEYQVMSKRGWGHALKAKVIQFPIRICYACTAHKMQGQTCKSGCKLIIHCPKRKMEKGMAYVMLGRNENLKDIYISGDLTKDAINVSQRALDESKKLLKIFQDNQAILESKADTYFQITFLNIRSLKAHLDDMLKDERLMSNQVIALGETWLHCEEEVTVDGFLAHHIKGGKGKGLSVFSKYDYLEEPKCLSLSTLSAMSIKTPRIDLIFLYLSKDFDFSSLKEHLYSWIDPRRPTAILGDMNWHYEARSQHTMYKYLEALGFQQVIQNVTHEKGNLIDHIYINDTLLNQQAFAESVPVYYSDHNKT